jgi:hypothetical protein
MTSHDLARALRRSRSEAPVFGEVYHALAPGGFVLMADPAGTVQSLVAFDRSGRALETADGSAVHVPHAGQPDHHIQTRIA